MGNQQIVTQEYKISGLVIVDVLKLYYEHSLEHIRDEEQIKILIKETFKLLLKKNLEIDEQTEPMVNINITKGASENKLSTPYLYQFDIDLKIMVQSAFFVMNSPKLFCQTAQQNVQKYQINDFFSPYGEIKLMVNFWENLNTQPQQQQSQNNNNCSNLNEKSQQNKNQEKQIIQSMQNMDTNLSGSILLQNNKEQSDPNQIQQFQSKRKEFKSLTQLEEQKINATEENSNGEENQSCILLNNNNKYNNDNTNTKSLEITEKYFNQNYKRLTNIQEGGFGEVALYYDCEQHKLLAVKSLKKAHTHTSELLAKERERVLTAIRRKDLPDSQRFQDEKIRGLRRNIVREIKLTYCKDQENSYHRINKLEGVVYFESSQQFLLVFEFFGNLLFEDNRLHCDLLDFIYQFKENKSMFKQMTPLDKVSLIRNSFTQLIKAVDFLHNQKDMVIRDLKDTNVLMKRQFNKDKLNASVYQIQLIDFGMSKDLYIYQDDTDVPEELDDYQLQRTSSINIQASHQGRHPKFLFNQRYLYEKKDDVFALGSLLYRLFQLFGLAKHIGKNIRDFIELTTGTKYNDFQKYFYLIDQDQFSEAKCLFNEKVLLERQQKVPYVEELMKIWDQKYVDASKFLEDNKILKSSSKGQKTE